MLDLESKNTLAGLNNDPNDSVRVKAKAVLRFKYRRDERRALKGPPITGPARVGFSSDAKRLPPRRSRTKAVTDRLYTSHTSVGVFSLAVDSYVEALTQNELYQRIKSRVGTEWKLHNGENKGTNQASEKTRKMKTAFKYLNSHDRDKGFRFISCGLRRQK